MASSELGECAPVPVDGRSGAQEVALHFDLDGPITPLAAGRSSQAWLVGDHSVVRVPIPNSGRLSSYRSEKLLGDRLREAGATSVAAWRLAEIRGSLCSVASRINGLPIDYSEPWTDRLASELAATLSTLHSLDVEGFGPLANTDTQLRGTSPTRSQGVVDRWFHAAIWPFDGVPFDRHVIHSVAPEIGEFALHHLAAILGAEAGPHGIVHSDLHRNHILVHQNGGLAGLLDFGDAFVGALAWDFALLHWYYGADNARRVAGCYPNGGRLLHDGETLALAVGLYKVAKNPGDTTVITRLRGLLER